MKIKIALAQETPFFFHKEKTLAQIAEITTQYAKEGCQLLVFPESFVPGYPRGFSFGTVVGSRDNRGRELYASYSQNSFDLESNDLPFLEALAKEQNIFLVVGVTEKNSKSGSLYCSMVYISPTKGLLGVHRKIKPTGQERIIWAEAGGESLVTFDTEIGKLGGLICWENYMPFARMAMYEQGVQIYIAPTADARPTWTSTMQHIALEGRCFVLGCNQYFTKSMYPEELQEFISDDVPEEFCRGGSMVVSPLGEVIAGPVFDKPEVLVTEIDLDKIVESKLDFDPIGHYNRPDIFKFEVRK